VRSGVRVLCGASPPLHGLAQVQTFKSFVDQEVSARGEQPSAARCACAVPWTGRRSHLHERPNARSREPVRISRGGRRRSRGCNSSTQRTGCSGMERCRPERRTAWTTGVARLLAKEESPRSLLLNRQRIRIRGLAGPFRPIKPRISPARIENRPIKCGKPSVVWKDHRPDEGLRH